MSKPSGKPPPKEGETTVVGQANLVASAALAKRAARLVQLKGPGSPRDFELHAEQTVIGRSDQADVTIDSKLISRMHVAFDKVGMQVRCVDLNSSNGVFLNGAKAHSAVLHDGDTLQIGDVVLVFYEGD